MIPKIIVIEDDADLLQYLQDTLKNKGEYDVTGFQSGTEAITYFKKNRPNLVTLDLNLIDVRGETVLKAIREMYSDLPVIILTGEQAPETLVANFNLGADDYVVKPFNADELLARISARLRSSQNGIASNVLTAKNISLNLETFDLQKNENKIPLTGKEFELLKYLLINKNRVCTREKILFSVWGYNSEVDTRVVDVFVGKLRKKLKGINEREDYIIESVWGYGYKIED